MTGFRGLRENPASWRQALRQLDLVAIPGLAFAISAVLRYEYFPVGDNWPLLTEIRHFLDPSYLARDVYAQEALGSFVRLPMVLLVALPIRLFGEEPVFHALFAVNGLVYGFAVAWTLRGSGFPRAAAFGAAAATVAFHQSFTIGFTDAVSGAIFVPSQLAWTLAWLALGVRLRQQEMGWSFVAMCAASTLFAPQVGMLAFAGASAAEMIRARRFAISRRTVVGGLVVVTWPAVLLANSAIHAAPGLVETNSYYRNPEHYLPGYQPWLTLRQSAALTLAASLLALVAARGISASAGRALLVGATVVTAALYVGTALDALGWSGWPAPATALVEQLTFGTRGVAILLIGVAIMTVALLRGLRPRSEITLVASLALAAAGLSAAAAAIGAPDALITFQGMRLTAAFEPIAFGFAAWLLIDATTARDDEDAVEYQHPPGLLARAVPTAITVGSAIAGLAFLASAITSSESLPDGGVFVAIEESTPRDALFIVPIDIQTFRGTTHRAQVVDWKHFPFRPDSVAEWRERIEAVAPGADVVGPREAYDRQPPAALAEAARRYGAEYVVTRQQDMTCAGASVALEDRWGYRVFEVGPDGWRPEACPP